MLTPTRDAEQLRTPITDLLKINHPVLLAGMNVAAGPKLAAAVTNAGGLGVIGGVGYTPEMLKDQIAELKSFLNDKDAPFGVDLLLPQVGGNARKTKYAPFAVLKKKKDKTNWFSFSAMITPTESWMRLLISSLKAAQDCLSVLSAFLPAPSWRSFTRTACST